MDFNEVFKEFSDSEIMLVIQYALVGINSNPYRVPVTDNLQKKLRQCGAMFHEDKGDE